MLIGNGTIKKIAWREKLNFFLKIDFFSSLTYLPAMTDDDDDHIILLASLTHLILMNSLQTLVPI